MASMFSIFNRDPRYAFSYELPTESFAIINGIFVGKSFKKSNPNEKGTCFWTASKLSSNDLKAQAQKLKTFRHPNVLIYLGEIEIEEKFYLLTEDCKPLEVFLKETSFSGPQQKELAVSWGLFQIMNCIKFLHEAKIFNNDLKNAIFVTSTGDWKLMISPNTTNSGSSQEDLNDLANVIWKLFSDQADLQKSSTTVQKYIPKNFLTTFRKLDSRGKNCLIADIIEECRRPDGFMKNKFVDTLIFLEEFQIKDSSEKLHFFRSLNDNLQIFPDDILRNKILPKLIHTYEYGDAGTHILVPMFKLSRLLDEEEYQQKIVPCLIKLFNSPDRTTRVKLLERIDEFAAHLKPQIINEKIYSNLVAGFLDINPAVREVTVKAIAALANKLNTYNLNTDLMKYLARVQGTDDQPSIRTNATICLGKIGSYLDPSHRQRILISAFTRAMKDSFPPARMAGVIGLSATQQFFSLSEVANRILPALSPLTFDQDKQAIHGFLEKLKKVSDSPDLIAEFETQVKVGGGSGSQLNSEKVPQWAGWAIKAISGKFYKAPPATNQPPMPSSENDKSTRKEENSTDSTTVDEATKKIEEISSPDSEKTDRMNMNIYKLDESKDQVIKEEQRKSRPLKLGAVKAQKLPETLNKNGWDDFFLDDENKPKNSGTTTKNISSQANDNENGWDEW